MAANHDWTKPKSKVTPEKLIGIMDVIVENIGKNGGRWTATINDIMTTYGETDSEEYGTFLQATDMAIKQFGLKFEKSGRNGRTYTIDTGDLADFMTHKARMTPTGQPFQTSFEVTIICSHCTTPTNYTIDIKEKR